MGTYQAQLPRSGRRSVGRRVFANPNTSTPARLRVMLNGGIYEELARRLVIAPFERDTGATVEVIPGSAAQIITRLMAEKPLRRSMRS